MLKKHQYPSERQKLLLTLCQGPESSRSTRVLGKSNNKGTSYLVFSFLVEVLGCDGRVLHRGTAEGIVCVSDILMLGGLVLLGPLL